MLPVSWGGVHSRAALQPQTSSSLRLLGAPGFSAGPKYGGSEGAGLAASGPAQDLAPCMLPWPDPISCQLSGRRWVLGEASKAAPPSLARTNHQDVDGCLGFQAFQLHGELIAA